MDTHTLLYHVLLNTEDGDKVISNILDSYIKTKNCPINNHQGNSSLQIEFCRLESDSSRCDIVKDILSVKNNAASNVLLHPVIEAYIDLKWIGVKKYVSAHFWIYLAFLLTYSWFLANIFYRPLHQHGNTLVIDHIVLSGTDAIAFPSRYDSPSNKIAWRQKNQSQSSLDEQNSEVRNLPKFLSRLLHEVSYTKSDTSNITRR